MGFKRLKRLDCYFGKDIYLLELSREGRKNYGENAKGKLKFSRSVFKYFKFDAALKRETIMKVERKVLFYEQILRKMDNEFTVANLIVKLKE